jgi:hypothetical protein
MLGAQSAADVSVGRTGRQWAMEASSEKPCQLAKGDSPGGIKGTLKVSRGGGTVKYLDSTGFDDGADGAGLALLLQLLLKGLQVFLV